MVYSVIKLYASGMKWYITKNKNMHIKVSTHKVFTSKGSYEVKVSKIVGLRLRNKVKVLLKKTSPNGRQEK